MVRTEDDTSIPLKKSTRERLGLLGNKNESWDRLLNRLGDNASKVPLLENKIKELEAEIEELNKTTFELSWDLTNLKLGGSTLKEFKDGMKLVENVKCTINLKDNGVIEYDENEHKWIYSVGVEI